MAQNLKFIRLSGEFTRPNNTTPYAAGKVVADSTSAGTLLRLEVTQPSGSPDGTLVAGASYQMKSVELCKSSSGTTNAEFDLYLYSSGVTAMNDGAKFTLMYANKHVRIGKTEMELYTGDTDSDSAEDVNTDVDHVFKAAPDSTDPTKSYVYARIVASAAYTPVANEKFYVKVLLVQTN